tara:strand:- start:582 stop:3158 length:2577 start_codon:yes stop_codon:yes gene_type:complete
MALINLQTNLKSLKFGNDRPGGGNSGQPYKTRPIDQKQSTTGGPDFLLRGGSLAPVRAVRDVSRLTKFFFDFKNPNGVLFLAKQNVLSRQNVQTEVSGDMAKRMNISRTGYAGGNLNQGLYTPLSTIGQAGVGFTGTHLNLFGLDPSDPMLKRGKQVSGLVPGTGLTMYEDFQAMLQREGNQVGEDYKKRTKKVRNPYWPMRKTHPELWEETNGFEDQGGGPTRRLEIQYTETLPAATTNRLVKFYETKQIENTTKGGLQGTFVGGLLGIEGPELLYKYPGGPGSVLGIGKTHINFANSNIGGPLRTGMNNAYFTSNPDHMLGTTSKTIKLQKASEIGSPDQYNYIGASSLFWADLQNNDANLRQWEDLQVTSYTGYISDRVAVANAVGTTNNAFTKNQILMEKKWYDPLDGIPDRDIIVGPNNFTNFGERDYRIEISYAFGPEGNVRNLSPQAGAYGFVDGASSAYGRAYQYSGADNATVDIAKVNYVENNITRTDNNAGGGYSMWREDPNARGISFLWHNPDRTEGSLTFNQYQLMNETSNKTGATKESFINTLISQSSTEAITDDTQNTLVSWAPDYTRMNKELRLSLGNPAKVKSRFDYAMSGSQDGKDNTYLKAALDKITAAPMYEKDVASHPRSSLFENGSGEGRNDLAKFSIGIVKNTTSAKSWWMHFRAFIDSFSDAYTADWKDIKYAGRSEKFFNYEGFGREISLGWTVFAQSKAELIPMYRKLNYLASSLAGDYSDGGFMRGNLVKLNIGGYLYDQLGIITSLTYDVPQEATWEIALTRLGTYDRSVKELPHMIKVSGVKFKPIHSFIPRKMSEPDKQGATPFIALSNGVNNNYPYDGTYNPDAFGGK